MTDNEPLPSLPPPPSTRDDHDQRPVVLATVIGGGICLFAVIVGVVLLGKSSQGINEVATTGLVSIGATLAGGFGGWIARGHVTTTREHRRGDDQP
jgi:hypothetical protein